MKYAVIEYISPNEIQVKTGQLTCYFQHRCCTRDIQAPFQIMRLDSSRLEKGTDRLNFFFTKSWKFLDFKKTNCRSHQNTKNEVTFV